MKKQPRRTRSSDKVSEPDVSYIERHPSVLAVHEILKIDRGRIDDPLIRVETFRKGFSRKSLERLKQVSGLDFSLLALALSVSTKTLHRKQIFGSVQSEKMYELASLYATGISYFGEEGFRRWMERPLFTIGNRRPIELIDISEGISLLKTEIMRLQHGVAV